LIPGESGAACWPFQAAEPGLRSAARLLRRVHDATLDWPFYGLPWAFAEVAPGFEGPSVICHGDPGPWNMVWRRGKAVGLLDWDQAHPGHALEDVAYALEYLTPFRDDQEAVRWFGFSEPPDRRRRLEIFVKAYGLDDVTGMVDMVIQRQTLTLRHVQQLADLGVGPQRRWVREGFLDELARRVDWSTSHRHLVE
jgi:aminoglycoside phosphotransferase (APT) family kinase protein